MQKARKQGEEIKKRLQTQKYEDRIRNYIQSIKNFWIYFRFKKTLKNSSNRNKGVTKIRLRFARAFQLSGKMAPSMAFFILTVLTQKDAPFTPDFFKTSFTIKALRFNSNAVGEFENLFLVNNFKVNKFKIGFYNLILKLLLKITLSYNLSRNFRKIIFQERHICILTWVSKLIVSKHVVQMSIGLIIKIRFPQISLLKISQKNTKILFVLFSKIKIMNNVSKKPRK